MKGAIVIVDYGMGNVKSVRNALSRIGAACALSTDPAALAGAPGIILPGVGGFPECMQALERSGLSDPLRDAIARGVPYLGICLGLQVLFEESEEFGRTSGLGILPGRIRKFPDDLEAAGEALHVPHMGWNRIALGAESPLLGAGDDGAYFYFVHSYYAEPGEACRPYIAATCTHGVPFIASVRRGNLFATQFHPEKSGARGLDILRRFAALCGQTAAPSPSA